MSRTRWLVVFAVAVVLAATVAAYPAGMAKPKTQPPKAASGYVPAAREALDSLHGIESIVKLGVNCQDYSRRVGDAQIAIDRFLRSCPNDPVPPSRADIKEAMGWFALALNSWSFSIQHNLEAPGFSQYWVPASADIAAAEKAFATKVKTKASAKRLATGQLSAAEAQEMNAQMSLREAEARGGVDAINARYKFEIDAINANNAAADKALAARPETKAPAEHPTKKSKRR